MKRNLLWRGLLILASILLAVALMYPPEKKINLGLDLQGGMYLMLQVHTEDALRAETDSDMASLVDLAEEQKVTGLSARRTGDAAFVISGASPQARDTVADLAEKRFTRWDLSRQGDNLVFTMIKQVENEVRNGAVNQAVQTINNRIDQFGVTEPVIQPTATGHRIVVQLPGVDDPERVRRLIKNTAFLEFRIVDFPKGGGGVGSREQILANSEAAHGHRS
jgi:preprotein translocase subunit SecD